VAENDLESYKKRLHAVFEITKNLSGKHSLDELLQKTLLTTLDVVGAQAGSILMYDAARQSLVFRYIMGDKAQLLVGKSIKTNEGIAGKVFQSGQAILIEDAAREATHLTQMDKDLGFATKDMITVPLQSLEGSPTGVLQVLNKRSGSLGRQDMEIIEVMAALAATAIENARHHETRRLASMASLLAEINHDVKNMLNPVVISAKTIEILWKRITDLPMAESLPVGCKQIPLFLENIRKSTLSIQERMKGLVNCMRGIMTAPQMELWSVSEIIEKVVEAIAPMAKEMGVKLEKQLNWEIPKITLDTNLIYNAVYNLTDNAIKATPPGGGVILSSYFEAKNRGFPEDGFVAIKVSDTGLGIAPDILKRLFLDEFVSTKAEGTGLGTRIVKNAIDAHKGKIDVTTEQAKGSVFTVKLPL